MAETVFCPSCGENVELFVVIEKGDEIAKCSSCGLVLNELIEDRKIIFPKVLLAEDSKFLRELTQDIFIKNGIAKEVGVFEDGEELIEAYISSMTKMEEIALIVLDVNMPKVGGFETALAVRDIEKDFQHIPPVPILFFTVRKADQHIRELLQKLSPAAYVNKGIEASPQKLAERLYKVIISLKAKKK
ncbi:MAG TPA: response regulator [bacterium]